MAASRGRPLSINASDHHVIATPVGDCSVSCGTVSEKTSKAPIESPARWRILARTSASRRLGTVPPDQRGSVAIWAQ
jgi:hypothetical protein